MKCEKCGSTKIEAWPTIYETWEQEPDGKWRLVERAWDGDDFHLVCECGHEMDGYFNGHGNVLGNICNHIHKREWGPEETLITPSGKVLTVRTEA